MKDYDAMIREGRNITRPIDDEEFESDQHKRLPQPPLVKAAVSDVRIKLPMEFDALPLNNDILSVIASRESHRVFTGRPLTLRELSFLLWATQGIKEIRGNNYATLRTVPSGGARHGFETYILALDVEGLEPGAYHYLPMENELEYLGKVENMKTDLNKCLWEQNWACKASAVFFWSLVHYRCEWRYGIFAHRVALIDAGHVGQNLYLACEALGLGCCGVAAFDWEKCGTMFGLDPEQENVVYAAPVGAVAAADKPAEKAFYAFVKDEKGAQE